ncbi:putative ribonuclease H-like domain-containing protein [Tanacetum coccineum]
MCDKKNSILFTDTECVVLSQDFKLTDENHVLLKVPKKDDMYSIELKNVVPQRRLTCLFAKATPYESNHWHRRLGHKGKQHKASCRKPALSFMRAFGYLVTILNTIDHLGKFDGKANEGFFVGYSTNSKAFRVFNSQTRIVEENLHVQFSIKACDDTGKARVEIVSGKDYILLPLWTQDSPFSSSSKDSPDAGFKPSGDNEKNVTEEPGKEGDDSSNDQEKDDYIKSTNNINTASNGNNTNNVNAVSSTVNIVVTKVNAIDPKTSIELLNGPNMPELEDIVYSDDDEDVVAKANMNNLDASMPASPILTTRIHKDHPVDEIILEICNQLLKQDR